MPAIPKTGPSLFLGLELGIDQLRASLVDETLELAGVECVDFDSELPEYKYVFCWPACRQSMTFSPYLVISAERKVESLLHQERPIQRLLKCGSRDSVSRTALTQSPIFRIIPAEPFFSFRICSDRERVA